MIKRISDVEDARTDREISTPTFYLLGWCRESSQWEAVRKGLVSSKRGGELIELGNKRYERMMLVSQLELNVLGMPKDKGARLYHSIEGQRRVTEATHGRTGKRKGGRNH